MLQTIYTPDKFSGDDILTSFAFTSRILTKAELVVKTRVVATNVVATLVLDTDYSIDDDDVDNDDGGSVVLDDPLATGTDIYLIRNTARTQLVNIEEGGSFSPVAVMKALDRLTMITQEQDYKLRQAAKVPDTTEFIDMDLPLPSAGRLLRWNDVPDGLENTTAAVLSAEIVAVSTAVAADALTATLTHNLGSASAILLGVIATWQTSFKILSQGTNTITVELGTQCPAGGGTVYAGVSL